MPHKKLIRWVIAFDLLLLVIGIAIVLIVRSRPFHDYVLRKIIQKTQEATGGRVEIADYQLDWFGLKADVHKFVIRGTEPDGAEPLIAVDRLGIGLKVVSVLRGKVDLNDLAIEHPVIRLYVAEDGTTNIPRPEVPQDSKPVDVFDLAVKELRIERGELYYNDRRSDLTAELHDLQTKVDYNLLTESYDGSVTYNQGRLQFTNFNPFEHNLDAGFHAARSGLKLEHLRMTAGRSEVLLRGSLDDYHNPAVEGAYEAIVATEDLRHILKNSSLPIGQIATTGSLRYRDSGAAPFLEELFVDGHLNSPSLWMRSPQLSSELKALRGRYRLENGKLTGDEIQVNLLGGQLTADLRIEDVAAKRQAQLKGSLRSVSLNELRRALAPKSMAGVPIAGTLNSTIDASWHGGLEGLLVRSDATIKANTTVPASEQAAGRTAIPVNGVAHLNYNAARGTLSVSQSYLQTPHTQIRIQGVASERSSIQVTARSDDLRELDLLALSFRKAAARGKAPVQAPQLLGLGGAATVNAQIQGRTETLRITGQLAADNLQVRQEHVRILRTNFELSSSVVGLHNGYLETQSQGRIRFDVTAGLRKWSYQPSNPVTIEASTTQFPVAELKQLAGLTYPITGTLTADISLRGSQLRPEGQASVQLTSATVWEQPVDSLSVKLQGNTDSVHSTLAVRSPAGNASGDVVYYPRNQGYEARVDARNIQLDQLQAVRARELELTGVLNVSAQGQGTLKAPRLQATAQIPQLRVRQQQMNDFRAQVALADHVANLTLVSTVEGGDVRATGNVRLNADYDATIQVDTGSMPLELLLATYLPQRDDFHGRAEIHASLQGPLKNPARMEGRVEIPTFTMGYQSLEIANAAPIRVEFQNDVVTLQRAQLKGTGTDLQVEGTANLREGGAVNVAALGTLDLRLVQILSPETDSSGQVKLNIRARGERAHPTMEGDVKILNAAFRSPDAPLGLEKVNGDLAVRNNRLQITQLTGQTGGGTVSASGFVIYSPRPQFNVGLTAAGVRFRYPDGVRTIMTADLALTGGMQSALLSGRASVDRLSFARDFDLALFLDQFRGSSPPPSEGFSQNLRLNIAINATQALRLESAKLSLQGSGNLNLRGTAAQPVIIGRANLTGGEVFFLGRRYEIQNGVVNFTNPVHTEPIVNLVVRTTVNQYDVNLTFVGPIEKLRTSYTSDPPLAPVQIINLIAFGDVSEAAGTNANRPSNLGAEALLAKGVSSQISGQIERLAGLSHLSIDPTLGTGGQNPGAKLAIQQRVTSKLLFTFAMDVTSTQSETIQLEYQVNRGWSVRAVRDQNGGYALDVKRRKTF